MKRFYITTPIYYVNDKPHLGTAYSTVTADILNRYHRLFGEETLLLTGTDEHGQKVEQAAIASGKTTQQHCDDLSLRFKNAWHNLNVNFSHFFRTTDEWHKNAVQAVLQKLWDKGEIYADTYEGWYSVSDEIFYTEKDLVNGKAPNGKDVEKITEKNYFFKMSKYQKDLISYIEKNPDFIQPEYRKNEVLGFLRQPLNDLCISRPKSRLKWGIEIPFDKDYVTYVWFDALLNYATYVGLERPGMEEKFDLWWNKTRAVHLIGKDILTTHTVYWPTMLMAAGLTLPKTIFAHGWILNKDNEKMSKSKGSVMDAEELSKWVGVDGLRYFLAHDIPLGNDAPVSHELIMNRVNSDLANNIGNLLSRSTNLFTKFYDGKVAIGNVNDPQVKALSEKAVHVHARVSESILRYKIHEAIDAVLEILNDTNKLLEDRAPWKAAKTDLTEAATVLYASLEVLRISATLLSPVMPTTMTKLLKIIGVDKIDFKTCAQWGVIAAGTEICKPEPLFPRVE
jgi:methionyl-tRNA synthetase